MSFPTHPTGHRARSPRGLILAPLYLTLLSALLQLAPSGTALAAGAAQDDNRQTASTRAIPQDHRQAYRIAPGPLGDVLAQFAAQAGVPLSFNAAALQGSHSGGLQGHYSVQEGFAALLQGTSYEAQPGAHGYSLRRRPADAPAVRLTPVTVRGTADIKDLPYQSAASISVKTRDDIERFRGTSVGDMFQGTPGVLVGENRNSGGLDVNIRGMQGQGRVPVLIDGSRQESTVYRGYAGVASRSYVDPDLIGGMLIEKGPSMSAQGTGATGGLVSMRTIGVDDILKPGQDVGVRIRGTAIGNNSGSAPEPGTYAGYFVPRASYNSNCRFASYCSPENTMPASFAPDSGMDRPGLLAAKGWAGSIAVAKRLESVDLVAAYAQRRQGNYYAGTKGPAPEIVQGEPLRLPWYTETPVSMEGASRFRAGELVPNTQYESNSLLLKSTIYPSDEHEIGLSYMRYHSDFGEMMPSQVAGFGQSRQWIPSSVTANTYTAKYHWKPTDSRWFDMRANAWHTDTVSVINTPAVYSIELRDNTRRDETYKRSGLDLSNTMRFDALGPLKVDLGVALQHETMDTQADRRGDYGGARAGKRSEYSVFANLEWQPLVSVTFNAGLRQTWYRSEDNNALPLSQNSAYCIDADMDGACDPVFYQNRKRGMAPMFSVLWQPRDDLQFYARYAEALRMPSLFETTSGWSVSPALDIDLNPEHAKNREVGMNYLKDDVLRSGDKLRLKAAYFRNHTKDYLTRTPPNLYEENQMGTPGGSDFFRMRNIQSADFHGYELSGSYDGGVVFGEFGYTRYTSIEVCHVGSYRRYFCTDYGVPQSYINNMIPPKWSGNLLLGARLLDRRLIVGARGTFMGKRNEVPQYNNATGFNGPVPWHSYTLVDVFASYQVNDTLRVDFNIDNLTDRYYLDALSLGLVPAPGRTARLSVTMQF